MDKTGKEAFIVIVDVGVLDDRDSVVISKSAFSLLVARISRFKKQGDLYGKRWCI